MSDLPPSKQDMLRITLAEGWSVLQELEVFHHQEDLRRSMTALESVSMCLQALMDIYPGIVSLTAHIQETLVDTGKTNSSSKLTTRLIEISFHDLKPVFQIQYTVSPLGSTDTQESNE